MYATTVHPHVCGEIKASLSRPSGIGSPPRVWGNHQPSDPCRYACGSPPRVWGNLDATRRLPTPRFTPTCVGKSRWTGLRQEYEPVHPHVCGEIMQESADIASTTGSPPRVWGNRLIRGVIAERGSPPRVWGNPRSRPAASAPSVHPHVCGEIGLRCCGCDSAVHPHVCGEIRRDRDTSTAATVHPHVCGEISSMAQPHVRACRFTPTCVGKSRSALCSGPARGSPPRVWGNRHRPRSPARSRRFTPTCVGKSAVGQRSPVARCGSPPRVWGNRRAQLVRRRRCTVHPHVCGEIIGVTRHRALAVHPHVCGEISQPSLQLVQPAGSPPRVWGNHASDPTSCSSTVHPHVCGEIQSLSRAVAARGSPPRVWGNLRARSSGHRRRRFTPTCVGKSRGASS